MNYRKSITGLVVIDPYNDFISEGGKVWDRLKGVAEANQCIPHMSQVLEATRDAGIQVDRLTVNCLRAPRRIPVPRRRQLN